jgi:hypothetical protein
MMMAMMTKMMAAMTVMMAMMVMTMTKVTLSLSLCGEKQLPISHPAVALMSTVPSVVKAGTTTLQMPNHIVARMKQSSSIEISAGKRN